jgi:hypothetical protein
MSTTTKTFTTIGVTPDTRNRLDNLREAFGYSSYEELLENELLDRDDEGGAGI